MTITVFLADDNLIVREGVRALLELEDDIEVLGQAADYDELVAGADATQPQVIVTDIRMPPNFSHARASRRRRWSASVTREPVW